METVISVLGFGMGALAVVVWALWYEKKHKEHRTQKLNQEIAHFKR